jgi:type IV pilus assembly protein PilX
MKNTPRSHRPRTAQRGVVLISAILLLVVMTLLALAMFRSFGIQELIAGNVREKQRALQSAESAAQYAELWLTAPGNILTNSVDCSTTSVGLVGYSSTAVPYVCMKPVASIDTAGNVTTVPWKVSGAEVGFTFFPGANTGTGSGGTGTGDMIVSSTGILNSYYQAPRFYIGLVSYSATQALYRIDAWNYAATPATSAVVESNYVVNCTTCSVTGP